jgi:predicted GNAT superfamily acetyltransferase
MLRASRAWHHAGVSRIFWHTRATAASMCRRSPGRRRTSYPTSESISLMDSASAPDSLTVRPLDQPAEMKASVELYRTVLELSPTAPAVSPRLLWALRRNGGSVIGAFDGEQLVGFAYGFVGKDATSGEVYHYSQAAVVHQQWQGRGVGRRLKFGQRAYVLSTGITTMRWSYDPVRAGNGHFNLDVLGARAKWFVANLYGVEDMGRDPGHPSDRLIVEWDLTGPPSPPAVDRAPTRLPGWGELVREGADMLIGIPRSWSDVARDPERAKQVRTAVSTAFERTLGQGCVAVSCRADDADSAWYRLRPASASSLTPAGGSGSPSASSDQTQRP